MHDCGLLGRVFPEFQAISWRVVRDFYHKYTVDEHTLLTIRNLERLREHRGADPSAIPLGARWASRRLSCSSCRSSCTMSGSGATTTMRSRASAWPRRSLDRLQLAPSTREMVLFLIRHHLKMSLVAFRRDTEDPEIVKQFAALLGTEERLKMLCLMTLVDIEAVSPETLTPWKEELLWRLYVDTYNHLTQRYGDELIETEPGRPGRSAAAASIRSARPRRSPDFWKGCRSGTFSCFHVTRSIATCAWPATSSRTRCMCRSSAIDGIWTLAVVTLDKPFLFSNICGVLASLRDGHPARTRADESERPRAGRVSVHRRRSVPGTEPRRPGSGGPCAGGSGVGPRRGDRAAAGP